MNIKNRVYPVLPKWLKEYRKNEHLLAACWILNESPSLVEYKHKIGKIDIYKLVHDYLTDKRKYDKYYSVPYLAELYCDSQLLVIEY
jgi:hypothetical protein